jgi:hypothetical protein
MLIQKRSKKEETEKGDFVDRVGVSNQWKLKGNSCKFFKWIQYDKFKASLLRFTRYRGV